MSPIWAFFHITLSANPLEHVILRPHRISCFWKRWRQKKIKMQSGAIKWITPWSPFSFKLIFCMILAPAEHALIFLSYGRDRKNEDVKRKWRGLPHTPCHTLATVEGKAVGIEEKKRHLLNAALEGKPKCTQAHSDTSENNSSSYATSRRVCQAHL